MDLKAIRDYLSRAIHDGHKWQFIDLIGHQKKPQLYFSNTQWLLILVSISSTLSLKTGLSDNFIGYAISALSIFVGLFLTLNIFVFDKYLLLDHKIRKDEVDQVYMHKRKEFFKQFTSLTTYSILLSLLSIILLSIISLNKSLQDSIVNYPFVGWGNIQWPTLKRFIVQSLVLAFNTATLYFILDFALIVLFAVTSIHSYIMIEYNREQNINVK